MRMRFEDLKPQKHIKIYDKETLMVRITTRAICDLLNEQDWEIKELKKLKQTQNSKAIEVFEDIIKTCNLAKEFCGAKATALDITSATAYNQCIDDMIGIINNQITELRGGENEGK